MEERDMLINKLNFLTKEEKDSAKKGCAPKELSDTDLENVSGGYGDNSVYVFGEYICPHCGRVNKIGFWYM